MLALYGFAAIIVGITAMQSGFWGAVIASGFLMIAYELVKRVVTYLKKERKTSVPQNNPRGENKPNIFVKAYFWWKLDAIELNNQILNYNTLSIWKSVRKMSALLLIFSSIATIGFVISGSIASEFLVDASISAVLAIFVYRGHRWATMSAMIYWTLSKAYGIYAHSNIAMQLIWWAVYMKPLYFAYCVGRNPSVKSVSPENIQAPKESA